MNEINKLFSIDFFANNPNPKCDIIFFLTYAKYYLICYAYFPQKALYMTAFITNPEHIHEALKDFHKLIYFGYQLESPQ